MQEPTDKESTKTHPALPTHLKEEVCRDLEKLWQLIYARTEESMHAGQWIEMEKAVREEALSIGGKVLEAGWAIALGTGYQGSEMACGSCGHGARFVEHRSKTLLTLVRAICLKRAYYHCANCGKGHFPLDEKLSVVGSRFSAAIRSGVCRLAACASFADSEKLLGELSGVTIDRKTIRRLAEKVGDNLERLVQQEIAKVWKPSRLSPRETATVPTRLYTLADGVMVNIRKEGWKEAKLGAVFGAEIPERGQKPTRGATTYAATLEDSHAFGRRFYVEAVKQGLEQAKDIVPIADGAHWIWNEVEAQFPENRTEIIDLYHAKEKLYGAASVTFGEGTVLAKSWGERWAKVLEKGKTSEVNRALSRLKPRIAQSKRGVRQSIQYFKHNRHRMDYGRFKREGYFVGSGVVEAACKNLVGQRMKGAGMRWSRWGAQAMLQLRVAHLSNRWELTWAH